MKKNSLLTILFFLVSFDLFAQEAHAPEDSVDQTRFQNSAQLQILNKTTAKTSVVEIKVGNKIRFGSLQVGVKRCWQAPLDQRPESKILIDVVETKIGEDEKEEENRIFYGWLFASSPSISGLEHPIYDIVAIGCKNK